MLPFYSIGPENIVYVVQVDSIAHTNEHPFCVGGDPDCPCRSDSDLLREFIHKPLDNGLLTNSEAIRLFWGKQITSSQDTAITDEEIEQVMNEPSPLEVEVEENYHRPLRISAQFQGMMDSLLIEHD